MAATDWSVRVLLTDDRRRQIEDLFRRYGKGVGSYVLAQVGNADVAETITGSVFLIVVRRFEQCRTSPVAWLWSIVRSEIARYFRDRKDVVPLDVEPPDPLNDPRRHAESRESAQQVRRAMAELTEEQQKLIYMKFFLDLPNVEIAHSLGMTPGNVGVVAHRAVKRLREVMEPTGRSTAGAPKRASWDEASVEQARSVALSS